jgi:hypothetical protein
MTLRITRLKFLSPPAPGHKRIYEQCVECDAVFYRDYVPYTLSAGFIDLPCGHGITERHHLRVRTLDEQLGLLAILNRRIESVAQRKAKEAMFTSDDVKFQYILMIKCKPTNEIVALESRPMTHREAEDRIGEMWNEYAAHMPDRGMVGTARVKGERKPRQTISG